MTDPSGSTGGDAGRRAFFRTLLRGAAFVALAGASAFLLSKRSGARSEFQCVNDANCRDCELCCNCPVSRYSSPACGPNCSSRRS